MQYSVQTKIQVALLIKMHNPKRNLQIYANGSSFLLNVFSFICWFMFGVICKCIVTIDKIIALISNVLVALSISINSLCFISALLYSPLYRVGQKKLHP